MRSIKEIIFKNCPYYFFNDMININIFNPILLDTDKISFKSTDAVIYNTIYITIKSINHVKIDIEIVFILFLIM